NVTDSYLYGYDDVYIYGNNGNVTISGSDIYSDWDLDIYAGNNVTITNTTTYSYNDTFITADSGSVLIDPSVIVADNDVIIEAGQDITICDNSLVQAAVYAELIAGGNIYICANSQVYAGEEAYLETQTGDVTLGLVTAGDSVEIVSAGAILDNNGDALNITTELLKMHATSGIGTENGIETQVEQLLAENTVTGTMTDGATGDIWVRNNLAVNGDLEILGLFNTADPTTDSGGAIILENGYLDMATNTYNYGGDILLTENVVASRYVSIRANGSILDNDANLPGDYDVVANPQGDPIDATSELLAFNGTVGFFGGTADTWNPVEVMIQNGELYVYGSEEVNFVSVLIDGVVEPSDLLSVYEGFVPPGLIFFNGRVQGGLRVDDWFRAVSPSVAIIGNEDDIWTELLLNLVDPKVFTGEEALWIMDEQLQRSLDLARR
ncbi:MAG: FapA family protein, partial [Candidatus Omnitrophica bacterium]|nr:FapA family protein [Candidatus Omnitrophota bacterium]